MDFISVCVYTNLDTKMLGEGLFLQTEICVGIVFQTLRPVICFSDICLNQNADIPIKITLKFVANGSIEHS